MRTAMLAIVSLLMAAPSVSIAQDMVSQSHIRSSLQRRDIDQLRAELALQRATRDEASQDKARAYREAHLLFKDCPKDLRAICMISAQQKMRDADAAYRRTEADAFATISLLEKIVADAETSNIHSKPSQRD